MASILSKGTIVIEAPYINFECRTTSFRPRQLHFVRWLDWEQDYALAQSSWNAELTRDVWHAAEAESYQYCAVVEQNTCMSIAAVWRYSETAWEVAAVWTRPAARRQGYATSVITYATRHILAGNVLATCLTERGNLPMHRAAVAVGFYPAPRR